MKNTIHYAFVLDQSGSMKRIEKEVVSSFNEQVEGIKKLKKSNPDSEIKFTLCTFNDEIVFNFIDQNINKLKKIKSDDYQPNSCTALYDAMGLTFSKIRELLKPNDQVFIAIFTDGLENASTDYTAGDIRKKLAQADENDWQIKFFCQQENNLFYKRDLGINDSHILNITLNEDGFKAMETEVLYCIKRIADTQKEQK
jgi:hypothetical protein